jgi:hypothetical protein
MPMNLPAGWRVAYNRYLHDLKLQQVTDFSNDMVFCLCF